jgi:hypothetical protein
VTRSSLDLLADRLYDEIQGVARDEALHRIRLAMAEAMDLEVLSLQDIARVIKRGPRYMERLVTLEHKAEIPVLPAPIPGLKHRYTRESVKRWLKSGIPEIAREAA